VEELVRLGERAQACGADGREFAEMACAVADALFYSGEQTRAVQWAELAKGKGKVGDASWWDALRVRTVAAVLQGKPQAEQLLEALNLHSGSRASPIGPQVSALADVAGACFQTGRGAWGVHLLGQATASGSANLQGRAHMSLSFARANLALTRGNLIAALEAFRTCISESKLSGCLRGGDSAQVSLGFILSELGLHGAAEEPLLEGIGVAKRLGSLAMVASGLQNLGLSYLRRARFEDAERTLRESVTILERTQDGRLAATAPMYLAWNATEQGNAILALALAREALARGAENVTTHGIALATVARVHLLGSEVSEALQAAEQAMQLMREHQLLEHVALIHLAYCEALLANGCVAQAQAAMQSAHSWLSERAALLDDLAMRESFLTNVPEHARIMQLAREHLSASA
jgi:tetratricopeptide (TPR) repeat protein